MEGLKTYNNLHDRTNIVCFKTLLAVDDKTCMFITREKEKSKAIYNSNIFFWYAIILNHFIYTLFTLPLRCCSSLKCRSALYNYPHEIINILKYFLDFADNKVVASL